MCDAAKALSTIRQRIWRLINDGHLTPYRYGNGATKVDRREVEQLNPDDLPEHSLPRRDAVRMTGEP